MTWGIEGGVGVEVGVGVGLGVGVGVGLGEGVTEGDGLGVGVTMAEVTSKTAVSLTGAPPLVHTRVNL